MINLKHVFGYINRFLLVLFWGVFFVLIQAGLALIIIPERVTPVIENLLISNDDLKQSDIILVLSGGSGERIEEAVKLYNEGYAPLILVSSIPFPDKTFFAEDYKNRTSWGALMTSFAIRKGVPESSIIKYKSDSESTIDEARLITLYLKDKGYKSLILVTSDFHSRRAGIVFRRYADINGLRLIVHPAPDVFKKEWWKVRSRKKIVLLEYIKSFYYMLTF